MRKRFGVLNGVLAALFLLCAALQLNDPDPIRWMAIYAAAAVACVLHGARRGPRLLPALVGLVALGWAAALAPATLPGLRLGELARSMQAETPEVEAGREMLGLALVAAWMALLALTAGRNRRRPG